MKNLLLAATATLSLGIGSAFAAQPAAPQTSTEFPQTSESVGGPAYQRTVPAHQGESRHVIGGETFFFGNGVGPGGSDGAE
jgi:hypothetical protein